VAPSDALLCLALDWTGGTSSQPIDCKDARDRVTDIVRSTTCLHTELTSFAVEAATSAVTPLVFGPHQVLQFLARGAQLILPSTPFMCSHLFHVTSFMCSHLFHVTSFMSPLSCHLFHVTSFMSPLSCLTSFMSHPFHVSPLSCLTSARTYAHVACNRHDIRPKNRYEQLLIDEGVDSPVMLEASRYLHQIAFIFHSSCLYACVAGRQAR
jgi:hypothetical protein